EADASTVSESLELPLRGFQRRETPRVLAEVGERPSLPVERLRVEEPRPGPGGLARRALGGGGGLRELGEPVRAVHDRLCEVDARVASGGRRPAPERGEGRDRVLAPRSPCLRVGEREAVVEVVREEPDERGVDLDRSIPLLGRDAVLPLDRKLLLAREARRE